MFNNQSLMSGKALGADGNVYSIPELLADVEPIGHVNPDSYPFVAGNIVGADGSVYSLVDILNAMGGGVSIEPATADTLGGVKVGRGLAVTEDGTLSAPAATSGAAGIVKPGNGLGVYDGTINVLLPITTLERITHLEAGAQLSDVISTVNAIIEALEEEQILAPQEEQ